MRGLGQRLHPDTGAKDNGTGPAPGQSQGNEQKPIPVEVHQPSPTAMQLAQSVVAPVVDPLATAAIMFLVSIFVLLQREDLRDRMIRLFGSSDLHRTTVAMNDAARRLSRYFLTQLGINAAFGLIIGTGLAFAADAVPGGLGTARGAAGVPGRAAGRPAGADAGGKLLSTHARR